MTVKELITKLQEVDGTLSVEVYCQGPLIDVMKSLGKVEGIQDIIVLVPGTFGQ